MPKEKGPDEGIDVSRVASGEKAAWDRFVEKFAGLLHGVAMRTLRARGAGNDREAARDVVQDIFLRLVKDDFRLLKTFDASRASLPTWLTVVARSTAIDSLRRPSPTRDGVELDETLAAREDAPFSGKLELPPGLLSERQGQILRMLFDEDMDVSEVAGLLNVQAQTVRSLKHQALERLRAHYAAGGDA